MKNLKAELYFMRWTLCYMGIWFLVWGGMVLAMNKSVVDLFVKNADTPILLLEGYCKQNLWLTIISILVIVIIITFAVIAYIFQIKEERNLKNIPVIIKYAGCRVRTSHLIIIFASFVWIPIIMLNDIEPIEQYAQIQKDLAAVKEGNLRSDLVFLSSNYDRVDFVPYGDGYMDTAVCYHVTGVNESMKNLPAWEKIYVPDCLNFNIDSEQVFDEWKSIEWNKSHSAIYRITYTPNLHFVVSIEVESQGEREDSSP